MKPVFVPLDAFVAERLQIPELLLALGEVPQQAEYIGDIARTTWLRKGKPSSQLGKLLKINL